MDSEEGRFGVAPSVEPLQFKWTLYFERKSKENKSKVLNKTDYLNNLSKGRSFQTIRTFWSAWNDAQEQCGVSSCQGAANYHMFKEGVKPVWEDPKNCKGGKWVVVLPQTTTEDETLKSWMSLALTLLLGEWGVESEINGAVLSARPWGSMISLWNRNANDKKLIEEVSCKLKELFGVEQVKYQRHQATIRRNHVEKAKMSRPKRTSSSDDSASNSDASSSDGEDRAPRRRFEVSKGVLRELIERVNTQETPPVVTETPKEEPKEEAVAEVPAPIDEQLPTPVVEVLPAPIAEQIEEAAEDKDLPTEESDARKRRHRRKNSRERRSSTSNEDAQEILAVVPARRFPLSQVTNVHIGLAITAGIVASAISWASFFC